MSVNPTKFKEGQLIDIWREDCEERFELVEESNWIDEGKYSSCEVIFKDTETGKHYMFEITRSGSYYSHYEYEVYDSAVEVELTKYEKTITVKEWVQV